MNAIQSAELEKKGLSPKKIIKNRAVAIKIAFLIIADFVIPISIPS